MNIVTRFQLRDHVALLLFWWSLWSVADEYLLEFTPISELAVFLLAFFLYTPEWLQLLALARTRQEKLVAHHLDRI